MRLVRLRGRVSTEHAVSVVGGGGRRTARTSGTLVRTTASRNGSRSSSVVSPGSSFHFFSCGREG